jgi:hypothetical protein
MTHRSGGETERRKYPRFRVHERILGHLVDSDRPVRIRDISFGGFATETVEPLPVGHVEVVRFMSRDDRAELLEAQSLHCWPSCFDDGSPCWVTGFAFVGEEPDTRARVGQLIAVVTTTGLYEDAPER